MRIGVLVADPASTAPAEIAADSVWTDAVTTAGHTPVVRDQSTPGPISAWDVDAIIVSGTCGETGLPTDLWAVPKPVVVAAGSSGNPMLLMRLGSTTGNSSTNSWTVVDGGNPLVAGTGSPFAPWSSAGGSSKHVASPVAGAVKLALVNGKDTLNPFFQVPEGLPLSDGTPAPASRVAISQDPTAVPSARYLAIVDALVEWLVAEAAPDPAPNDPPVVAVSCSPPVGPGATFTLTATEFLGPGDTAVTGRAWVAVTPGAPAILTGAATATATGTTGATAPGRYSYSYTATNAAGTSVAAVATLLVMATSTRLAWKDPDGGELRPIELYSKRPDGTYLRFATNGSSASPITDGPPPPPTTTGTGSGSTAPVTGTGTGTAATPPTGDPEAVGLVVADNGAVAPAVPEPAPNNSDAWIKARLESLGYTVTYVADSVPTTPGTFGALFVSPTANAVDAGNNHRTFSGPMVVSHGAAWDDFTLSSGTVNGQVIDTGTIVGASHPIALAAGLAAGAVVYLTAATATRNGTGVVGTPVMDHGTVPGSRILTALSAGGLNSSGVAVPARRVLVGFDSAIYNTSGATRLNTAGLALFDASVGWAYAV